MSDKPTSEETSNAAGQVQRGVMGTPEGQLEAFVPPLCTDSESTIGKRWRWLMVSPIHSEEEARRYFLSAFGRPLDRARKVSGHTWCVGYVTSAEVRAREASNECP